MKSLSTFLTTLLTIVALFALAGWQVTGETASTRLLSRLAAAIVEIDRWLPAHYEDIQLLARDRPDDLIVIPDLPIQVVLPSAAVIDAEPAALESLIRREMGRQLYEDGNSAFRDSEGNSASLGITEPVRWTVTLLGPGMHGVWLALLALTVLLALAAAASVMTIGENPVHAIATGAVIGAVSALAFFFLMKLLASMTGDHVDQEIALILKDGAWVGVRICGGVAFASGVIAFLLHMGRGHGQPAATFPPPRPRSGSPFS